MTTSPTPAPMLISHVRDSPAATKAVDARLALFRAQGETNPARLFEVAQGERFRALQAHAPNTQRGYASDWRGFVRFCEQAGLRALPASPSAIEAFIEFSLPYSSEVPYQYVLPESPRRNVKVSTLTRALAAIAAVHAWLEYPDPTAHPSVAHTLKINCRGRSGKQPKAPLPYSTIERALSTLGETLPALRTKALASLAFSTLLRRSELVALEVADFAPNPHGDNGVVRVRSSKTDPAGHGAERYVSAPARRYVEQWLAAAGITMGPIFARLNRNGEPLPKALHPNQVALAFKALARRAGYAEHEIERIAAHSTRIGAAHALNDEGFTGVQIQHAGGWGSEKMPGLYTREQAVLKGAMAQWFRKHTRFDLDNN